MAITIYHNQKCGTSRNTLKIIQDAGIEPTVVNYLQQGWTRQQLLDLFKAAGLTPREAMREKEAIAMELGLRDEDVSDDQIINAMIEHSILVNRPFVSSPKGVRLCRPKELVIDLL